MNTDRRRVTTDSLERAERLVARLRARVGLGHGARVVVGIAGESGSGKSVAATSLARALERAGYRPVVLPQDDYFIRPPRANHAFRLQNIHANVGPHEVHMSLIADHVAAFRDARDVVAPLVDYAADSFRSQQLALHDADVLILEGTFVLQLPDLDVRVFCSATHKQTYERRVARARDPDDPDIERILAIEHALIAPQATRADFTVDHAFTLHERNARA